MKNQPGITKLSWLSSFSRTLAVHKISSTLIPILFIAAATTTALLIASPSSLSNQSAYAQSFGARAVINTNTPSLAPCIGCEGVQLVNIHTLPSVVIVGNTFRIGATVINDSPHTIIFISGPCDSPLSTTFDRNVLVQHGPQCYLVAQLVKLKPGEEATGTGPNIGTIYKAISAGQTTAIVTFHYYVEQYYGNTISKSFAFTIRPSL